MDMLNFDYDYGSIMHYPARAPGSDERDLPDIIAFPDDSVAMGQREGLSELDVKKLCRAYNREPDTHPRYVGPTKLPPIGDISIFNDIC